MDELTMILARVRAIWLGGRRILLQSLMAAGGCADQTFMMSSFS